MRPTRVNKLERPLLNLLKRLRAKPLAPADGRRIEGGHRLTNEVATELTPGHSPGHMAVRITSGGHEGVVTGDLIHHPIQCAAPWLSNAADVDPAAAVATRMALLEELADTPSYLLTGHFPAPTAGRVIRHGDAYRFRFED